MTPQLRWNVHTYSTRPKRWWQFWKVPYTAKYHVLEYLDQTHGWLSLPHVGKQYWL